MVKLNCECPICKSPVNEEIERYVQSELYKMVMDHSYKPVSWGNREK